MSQIESKAQAYRDRQLNEYLDGLDSDQEVELSYTVCIRTSKSKKLEFSGSETYDCGFDGGKEVADTLALLAKRHWERYYKNKMVTRYGKDRVKPARPYMRYNESGSFAMASYGNVSVHLESVKEVEPPEPDYEAMAEARAEARAARYDY